jgi:hypothetical protein
MINYTWKIDNLSCYDELNGLTDVVFKVEWTCLAEEQDGDKNYNTQWMDKTIVPIETGDQFTPFQQLTEEQILGWVWQTGLDKNYIESRLVEGINEQKTAPSITEQLVPWNAV